MIGNATMERKTRPGRDFEELVARLEKILAPRGATIKSPDHIRDSVTGISREVDVSIRFADVDSDRLITVECRDRQNDEDVTWIEQLVTKQKDIGAWKTYAVSSAGFSGPAIAKAKHNGIEIRLFSEITDAVIAQEWATSSSKLKLDILMPDVYLVNLKVHSDGDLPGDFYKTLKDDLTMIDLKEFFTPSDFQKLSAWLVDPHDSNDSFHFSLSSHYALESVPGESIEADFVAQYMAERRVVSVPVQSVQQYKSPEETLFQVLEGSAVDGEHSFRIKVRGRFKPIPQKRGHRKASTARKPH